MGDQQQTSTVTTWTDLKQRTKTLLARSKKRQQPGSSLALIDRRELIKGMGVAAAAASVFPINASASNEHPVYYKNQQRLGLTFAGLSWIIDEALWGDETRVTLSPEPKAKTKANSERALDPNTRYTLRLDNAVYPGTNLKADFKAVIRRANGTWKIELKFHDCDTVSTNFLDWISGKSTKSDFNRSTIYAGGRRALKCSRDATIRWDAKFNPSIEASFIKLRDSTNRAMNLVGTKMTISMNYQGESHVSNKFSNMWDGFNRKVPSHGLTTVLEISNIQHVQLGHSNTQQKLLLQASPKESTSIYAQIEAFHSVDGDQAFLQIFGKKSSTLQIHPENEQQESKAQFSLDECCAIGKIGHLNRVCLATRFSESSFGVDFKYFSTRLKGIGDIIYNELSGKAFGPIHFPLIIDALSLPVDDASTAEFRFRKKVVDISISSEYQNATSNSSNAVLSLTPKAKLVSTIDDEALLSIARSKDLFNLKFSFRHYTLLVNPPLPEGRNETPAETLLFPKPGCNHRLIAHFPPQHVREQIWKDDSKRLIPRKRQPDVMDVRHAGPTRLVFQGLESESDSEQKLTIERLTDWKNTSLIVHKRALPRDASIESQLEAMDLYPSETNRTYACATIRRNMDLRNPKSTPGELETALEPVYGLIFSPDASGQFITPQTPTTGQKVPYWKTHLDLKRNSAVRALNSRDFDIGIFDTDGSTGKRSCKSGPDKYAMNTQDRLELVMMSSVYGMGALRRLTKKTDGFFDDPAGMVIRDKQHPKYISDEKYPKKYKLADKEIEVYQEGVIVPRPFTDFYLTLSPYRANLNARWTGEPPAPFPENSRGNEKPFFNRALNIENYIHRASLGRDILVQVDYKGFLFPVGHRASKIKLTERVFLPYQNPDENKYPTAYLTKREFLIIRHPSKRYPALNQPFKGRQFPSTHVSFTQTVTPDLVFEQADISGFTKASKKQLQNCETKAIFWPRIKKDEGNEYLFEYKLDGDESTARSPLLWVSNSAAHDPATVKLLVKMYNELDKKSDLLAVKHGGVDRIYAPTDKVGETSFHTTRWVLGATGRSTIKGNKDRVVFGMDALMEGADQPPFYPTVREAHVQMESLDRLLGKSQGLIRVAVNSLYRDHGLDHRGNPSELFLSVLSPEITLDFSNQGQTSGGVAKPNSKLAGLSRSIGFVGGSVSAAGGSNLALAGISRDPDNLQFNMSAAESGKFDPFQFLPDAKLLGVINLKDILRVVAISYAPQLKQAYQFSGLLSPEFRAQLAGLASSAHKELTTLLSIATDRLQEIAGDSLSLSQVYPDLHAQLIALRNQLILLSEADQPDKVPVERLFELSTGVYKEATALLDTIASLAADPVPAFVTELLKSTQEWKNTLQDYIDSHQTDTLAKELLDTLFYEILEDNYEIIEGLLGNISITRGRVQDRIVHFPEVPQPGNYRDPETRKVLVQQIIENPANALPRISESLFYSVYGESLQRLLVLLAKNKPETAINSAIDFLSESFIDAIEGVLQKGIQHAEKIPSPGIRDTAIKIAKSANCQLKPNKKEVEEALKQGRVEVLFQAYEGKNGKIERFMSDIRQYSRELSGGIINGLTESLTELENEKQCLSGLIDKKTDDLLTSGSSIKSELEIEITKHRSEIAEIDRQINAIKSLIKIYGDMNDNEFRDYLSSQIEVLIQPHLQNLKREAQTVISLFQKRGESAFKELLTTLTDQARNSIAFSAFSRYRKNHEDWCKGNQNKFTDTIEQLCFQLIKPTSELSTAIAIIANKINKIKIIPGMNSQEASRFITLKQNLATSFNRASEDLLVFAKLRKKFNDGKINYCNEIDLLIQAVNDSINARRRSIEEFINTISDVNKFTIFLSSAPTPIDNVGATLTKLYRKTNTTLNEIKYHLADLLLSVSGAVNLPKNPEWIKVSSTLKGFKNEKPLSGYPQITEKLDTLITAIEEQAKALCSPSKGTNSPCIFDFALIEQQASDFVGIHCKRIASHLVQTMCLGEINDTHDKMLDIASTTIGNLTNSLLPINNKCKDIIETIIEKIGDKELLLVLFNPSLHQLNDAKSSIETENKLLKRFDSTNWNNRLEALDELERHWKTNPLAVVFALEIFRDIGDALASGNIKALFDFDAIETALKDLLKEVIPARQKLDYNWDTQLSPFPSNDPIFEINRSITDNQTPSDYVLPNANERWSKDLSLSTEILVDLLTLERKVTIKGRMRPFKINLLGNAIDLLTIKFKGMKFDVNPDQSSSIKADIDGVELGSALQFVKAIQSFMSPGEGNGPYIVPTFLPPGIEAGYRYSAPIITVGSLFLYNVAIDLKASLPFSNREALFSFAFAQKNRPFLISSPPYGGGGFVGLTANAKGIIGFEIQIEFGAVVGISFGPMTAQGRVTSGIYLKSSPALRILEGFVRAIGEGNIACFSICVNIEVAVRQENSNMTGSSSYSFTFKVGFFEVSYGFTASYEISGGESNNRVRRSNSITENNYDYVPGHTEKQEISGLENGLRAEDFSYHIPMSTDDYKAKELFDDSVELSKKYIRVVSPPKSSRWRAYRSYYDL